MQFEVFRRNPQLTQNKIYKFHSISWGFQLYKLTSFNWNLWLSFISAIDTSFNCTNLHPSTETSTSQQEPPKSCRFNCTNLHPSTETVIEFFSGRIYCVSIVQTYILQLKLSCRLSETSRLKFQLYKLTSFNWNNNLRPAWFVPQEVSIVQTYILQLKLNREAVRCKSNSVSIVQTYIFQLKQG